MPMNETPFDIEGYYRQNFPPGMSEAKKQEMLSSLHQAMKRAPRTFSVTTRNKAEMTYKKMLDAIFLEMTKRTAGLTDPDEVVRALRFFAESPQFERICESAAQRMATMLAAGQKADWRAAASASSQGRKIYQLLMKETTNTAVGQTITDIVAQNAQLIKTVPQNMAGKIVELVRERTYAGKRPDDIMKEIMELQPHLSEIEARRIARTESSKASTALVQARAEALGLDFYVWRTAGDGNRVRKSHQAMEGVICRWSDPPDPEALAGEERSYGPYHPGCIFNCRCTASSILDPEDIEMDVGYPAKVHKNGKFITVQNLAQFKAVFGLAA